MILPSDELAGVEQPTPHCVNCAHFHLEKPADAPEMGLCSAFNSTSPVQFNYWLVSGKGQPPSKHVYCSTARGDESQCGESGKKFQKKEGK